MSNTPKYLAYKPVAMTDGLHTWVQHTFDNTVDMTSDDEQMFISTLIALSTSARITAMQERLNGLQKITPAIQVHSDAIRAIYAEIKNHHSVTRDELDLLSKADELWVKILVLRDMLPKAIMCKKNSKTQSNRAKRPRKLSEKNMRHIVARYRKHESEGSVYGVVKELARKYDVTEKAIRNVIERSTQD